ncbi:hypothetical protein U9M48_035054 [Paspalum notatum var. saurae]|uniref:Uncharacterized protein n=1 Tax=Paspalum notatum var. saurae TaxID=547442 RepID=A0AAQ3UC71_PASNO
MLGNGDLRAPWQIGSGFEIVTCGPVGSGNGLWIRDCDLWSCRFRKWSGHEIPIVHRVIKVSMSSVCLDLKSDRSRVSPARRRSLMGWRQNPPRWYMHDASESEVNVEGKSLAISSFGRLVQSPALN